MNVKNIARIGGQAVAAGTTARTFVKARREGDKLRMLDAIITALSIAVTVAVIVRELRQKSEEKSRVVDLEDAR